MAGKGGSGGNVIGYRYSLGILMGLCRGPVNGLLEIRVGDLEAWADPFDGVNDNTTFEVSAPDLFGGDEKEGGIAGNVELMMGAETQDISGGGFASIIGMTVSHLRGVLSLYFNGVVCVNNPYPKPWSFRVWRTNAGWDGGTAWYADEAMVELRNADNRIIYAMNPAHIIYECLTNRAWGRGLSPSRLDEDSFISAANTLCREEFGLCMAWTRSQDLGAFIQSVFDHIGAVMYPDRASGLLVLKLLRYDYVVDDLPVFDYTSGLLQVLDDDATATDNAHSEIIVNYMDPIEGKQRQVRVQNLAGTVANQTVSSTSVTYDGIPTAGLALRVAQRDLSTQAGGIKRFKLKLDRRGRKIAPGTVFRVTIPDRNISNMVLRAGSVEEGPIAEQSISVVAVQDVFSLEATTYMSEPEHSWAAPDRDIYPIDVYKISEINYRDTVSVLTPANLATVAVDSGDVVVVAKAPSTLSLHYELHTAATGESYAAHGSFGWTPTALVVEALGYYDTSFTVSSAVHLAAIGTLPTTAWIDDEIVEVASYDAGTGAMTVSRGCVDTLPVPHAAGARIWFARDAQGTDGREYTTGEDIRLKLLPRVSTKVMAEADAVEHTWTVAGRQGLPYAPGDFKINGTRFADVPNVVGDVVMTWAHRDRITQADHVLSHTDASTGPETAVTYQTRIYDHDGVSVLRAADGLTTDTWTYDSGMQAADGSPPRAIIKLRAERDGLLSFQEYSWPIYLVALGYGRGYGLSYGSSG